MAKDPHRFSRSSSNSIHQSPHIPIREPNLATGLYAITGVDNFKGERITNQHAPYPIYYQNEIIKSQQFSNEQQNRNIRHHRRKNERRHILRDQPLPEVLKDTSIKLFEKESTSTDDSTKESLHPNEANYDGDEDKEREEIVRNRSTEPPLLGLPNLPRRCNGQSEDSNCTPNYHFPSSVLMIEAHYNQTVRDFLQICTPVERVEIDSLEDVQVLLNALYQQMAVNDGRTSPSSMVLLFNLEHYANWTKERVVEILQATVNALHTDFNDMMIYSKFHQDGADYNDTHLTLTYDVKYWLADLCNQRLIPCADFASIILESVLRMNEIENDIDNPANISGFTDSLEDASSQANA